MKTIPLSSNVTNEDMASEPQPSSLDYYSDMFSQSENSLSGAKDSLIDSVRELQTAAEDVFDADELKTATKQVKAITSLLKVSQNNASLPEISKKRIAPRLREKKLE